MEPREHNIYKIGYGLTLEDGNLVNIKLIDQL